MKLTREQVEERVAGIKLESGRIEPPPLTIKQCVGIWHRLHAQFNRQNMGVMGDTSPEFELYMMVTERLRLAASIERITSHQQ